MKLFVDTASVDEIQVAVKRGFVSGVTTNPALLAKEPKADFNECIEKIIAILDEAQIPLSVEVFATEPSAIIEQAQEFVHRFGHYSGLTIKVPIGWDEMAVIHELVTKSVQVNVTCIMSVNQAIMAAAAGARYVSIFAGRIRDIGYDAMEVIRQTRQIFDQGGIPTEIIVGSIRHLMDVNQAFLAGAHIVTVPPTFLKQMVAHPKTDEAVNQFVEAFKQWTTS